MKIKHTKKINNYYVNFEYIWRKTTTQYAAKLIERVYYVCITNITIHSLHIPESHPRLH